MHIKGAFGGSEGERSRKEKEENSNCRMMNICKLRRAKLDRKKFRQLESLSGGSPGENPCGAKAQVPP